MKYSKKITTKYNTYHCFSKKLNLCLKLIQQKKTVTLKNFKKICIMCVVNHHPTPHGRKKSILK